MTPENLLSEWARLLVVSLADAGLRDIVVSPGSRSTPLVAAALASNRFDMTSVVDERSAAFYALGRARMTGVPAAVICTSGSAAANYFPAVVEAAAARVPLLVVTADRPFELHGCGAAQTLDQTRLYGTHVRAFVDLGMPESEPSTLAAVRRRAAQCVAATLAPEPGPVHLDVRARKPLEPVQGRSEAARDLTARVDALLRIPSALRIRGPERPSRAGVDAVARSLGAASRGLLVCGPAEAAGASAAPLVTSLARATGFPVYAETTSQLRFGESTDLPSALSFDALDVLLRVPAFGSAFSPDAVLQIGAAPTSGAWERFVAEHPRLERHVVAPGGWPDPASTARTFLIGDVDEALAALLSALGPGGGPPTAWAEQLSRANAIAWSAVDSILGAEGPLTEGAVLRTVTESLAEGSLLALGNSLPVRHVDVFCRARPGARLAVWSQRGLSGIDGVVSGAAGAADVCGRPSALVVGDVSALHDAGGLAAAKDVRAPFVVVVVNNGGGRIFEQLPIASAGLDATAERFWITPHTVRFDALAAAFGVGYDRVDSVRALATALGAGLSRRGCTVIEATVPPHGAREQYDELRVAVEAALAANGTG